MTLLKRNREEFWRSGNLCTRNATEGCAGYSRELFALLVAMNVAIIRFITQAITQREMILRKVPSVADLHHYHFRSSVMTYFHLYPNAHTPLNFQAVQLKSSIAKCERNAKFPLRRLARLHVVSSNVFVSCRQCFFGKSISYTW